MTYTVCKNVCDEENISIELEGDQKIEQDVHCELNSNVTDIPVHSSLDENNIHLRDSAEIQPRVGGDEANTTDDEDNIPLANLISTRKTTGMELRTVKRKLNYNCDDELLHDSESSYSPSASESSDNGNRTLEEDAPLYQQTHPTFSKTRNTAWKKKQKTSGKRKKVRVSTKPSSTTEKLREIIFQKQKQKQISRKKISARTHDIIKRSVREESIKTTIRKYHQKRLDTLLRDCRWQLFLSCCADINWRNK